MSFRLVISCDVAGCDAETSIGEGDEDEVRPCVSTTLRGRGPDEACAMFVLDSGWIDMPKGWTLADAGELCPAHSTYPAA